MKKIKSFILMALLISAGSKVFAAGVDRYAVYVGSNNGGKERQQLLYAGTDAQSFKKTMAEVGGIAEENSYLLIDPTKKEINKALADISAKIEKNKALQTRSEFLFYYSGHSDEDALLLGDAKYDYSSLKQTISDVPSDIHVVILDSCYSGNFIRTKGGQKKKPFLMDDSSVVKGHAYLSSSSETESSQESDEIGASYFTNSVITGLRGAADTSGDKKVTLNELYSYAFNETLKKTEDTKAGPQHPNYNITLVGSGDLILSDFSESDSVVSIAKSVHGKVLLRDSNGKLVSEINKTDDVPVLLALPEGNYSVVIVGETSTLQGNVVVKKDEAFVIDENSVSKVETKQNTVRGESKDTVQQEETKIDWKKVEPKGWILPFDFKFAWDIPCSFDAGPGNMRWYMADDLSIPAKRSILTADLGFSLFTVNDVSWTAGSLGSFGIETNNTGKSKIATISPYFGFMKNDGYLPFEGWGVTFYPCYEMPVYNSGKNPYYDYRTAFELQCALSTHHNFYYGIFERCIQYYKDNTIGIACTFGFKIGGYIPSKRNLQRVRNTRNETVGSNHSWSWGSDTSDKKKKKENKSVITVEA